MCLNLIFPDSWKLVYYADNNDCKRQYWTNVAVPQCLLQYLRVCCSTLESVAVPQVSIVSYNTSHVARDYAEVLQQTAKHCKRPCRQQWLKDTVLTTMTAKDIVGHSLKQYLWRCNRLCRGTATDCEALQEAMPTTMTKRYCTDYNDCKRHCWT